MVSAIGLVGMMFALHAWARRRVGASRVVSVAAAHHDAGDERSIRADERFEHRPGRNDNTHIPGAAWVDEEAASWHAD